MVTSQIDNSRVLEIESRLGRTATLELLSCIEDESTCCRVTTGVSSRSWLLGLATDLGLEVLQGYLSIQSDRLDQCHHYSEWAQRSVISPGDESERNFYFGRKVEKLELLRSADEAGDDRRVGKMLGYPCCCIDWFYERHSLYKDRVFNRSDPDLGHNYRWYMNTYLAHQDFAILSHFPCSLGCEESQLIARKRLEILKKYMNLQLWRKELSGALIVTKLFGAVKVAIDSVSPSTWIVSSSSCEPQSFLAQLLREGGELFDQEDGISVDGVKFMKPDIRLYRFTD